MTSRCPVWPVKDGRPAKGVNQSLVARTLGDVGRSKLNLCVSADSWTFPPSHLQRVPSDQELSRLASRLGAEWESVLLDLGLSVETLFRCRADHALSAHGAALAGLVQWRRRGGRGATFQRLIQSLKKADVHPSVLGEVLT